MNWPVFDEALWAQVVEEAGGLRRNVTVPLVAYDRSQASVGATRANVEAAGLSDAVTVARATLDDVTRAVLPDGPSLIVCNPPYGHRIGAQTDLKPLYGQIGELVRGHPGCRLALLTSEARLARATGLSFARTSERFPHGGLRVQLFLTEGGSQRGS